VERAGRDDRYGDIFVDTNLSHAVYLKWKALARPAPGPGNLRRPLWFPRVARPTEVGLFFRTSTTIAERQRRCAGYFVPLSGNRLHSWYMGHPPRHP